MTMISTTTRTAPGSLIYVLLILLPISSSSATAATTQNKTPDFGPDFVPSQQNNMNNEGRPYPFSPSTEKSGNSMIPNQFRDYPGGVEMFEVYSPEMTTLYSQVWWKALEPVALPPDVIQKYMNKGMAIVGWEIDQVTTKNNGEEISVPISASYNHHFVSFLIGAETRVVKVTKEDIRKDPTLAAKLAKQQEHSGGCGGPMANLPFPQYLMEGNPVSSVRGHLPTRQQFSSANGGEYRKTFHGFAPSQVLVVDSPQALQVTPMQIDTWNRDKMKLDGEGTPFVPGPLPRASLAGPHAFHSGLLECPMTTRLTKVVDTSSVMYQSVQQGNCGEPIMTFYECYPAAAEIIVNNTTAIIVRNETGHDPNLPTGCLILSTIEEEEEEASPITITTTSRIRRRTTQRNKKNPREEVVVFFNEFHHRQQQPFCSLQALCVCPNATIPFGKATGSLLYHPTNQSADIGEGKGAYFNGAKCSASSTASSLLQQRNPTCDIRHYQGGQWACHHMWPLLDADQEIPWTDQPLVLRHKYRFWVQPYTEDYHTPVVLGESVGSVLLIGSPWEYDVPKCAQQQQQQQVPPGCKYDVATKTWIHTITGTVMGKKHPFVSLNNHCHAPTCLSSAVYACFPKNNATYSLEDCNASTGQLICESKPVYGHNGNTTIATKFEEAGFIAIPACIWADGLDLDGIPLHIVKTSNATEGHYGEMSGGQPWVIY